MIVNPAQPVEDDMDKPRIVTSYNATSPHPDLDWCAYRDGTEETGVRGWGRTKKAAIANLIDEEFEPCDCADKAPAKGVWFCPKCDAQWGQDDDA